VPLAQDDLLHHLLQIDVVTPDVDFEEFRKRHSAVLNFVVLEQQQELGHC
jgi:hypothetical protein